MSQHHSPRKMKTSFEYFDYNPRCLKYSWWREQFDVNWMRSSSWKRKLRLSPLPTISTYQRLITSSRALAFQFTDGSVAGKLLKVAMSWCRPCTFALTEEKLPQRHSHPHNVPKNLQFTTLQVRENVWFLLQRAHPHTLSHSALIYMTTKVGRWEFNVMKCFQ